MTPGQMLPFKRPIEPIRNTTTYAYTVFPSCADASGGLTTDNELFASYEAAREARGKIVGGWPVIRLVRITCQNFP